MKERKENKKKNRNPPADSATMFCRCCTICVISKYSKGKTVDIEQDGSPCSDEPKSHHIGNHKADKLSETTADLHVNERLSMIENSKIDVRVLRQYSNTIINELDKDIVKESDTSKAQENPDFKHNLLAVVSQKQELETDTKSVDREIKNINTSDIYGTDYRVWKQQSGAENVKWDYSKELELPSSDLNKDDNDFHSNRNEQEALGFDYKQSHKRNHISFKQTKVQSCKAINIQMRRDPMISNITGYAFLPDSRVLLCDNTNDKIKVLNPSFELTGSVGLKDSPCDIALLNENTAVVTLPGKRQLQYLKVNPKLKKKHVIKLDMPCWAIDIVGEDIFITCHSICGGNGEVRVLDLKGKCKRRVNVQEDESGLFVQPDYLAVCRSSKNIYVSDAKTSVITCLRADGSVIYRFRDEGLTAPEGISIDADGNVIIVSEVTNNVQLVSEDGLKSHTLLTMPNGLNAPQSLGYRKTDNTLIIGCFLNTHILVIKLIN